MVMKFAADFQKLDDLIGIHTKPPVTAILRNQLHFIRDQVEADFSTVQKPLTSEQRKVLSVLNRITDYCKQETMAQHLGIDIGRTVWLLERLQESGYVDWGNPDRYRINPKGRDALYAADSSLIDDRQRIEPPETLL
jgi:hypothetical protein